MLSDVSKLTTLSGSLHEVGTLDLLQAIHDSKRSASLALRTPNQRASVFFRNGDIIEAELGALRGERALRGVLCWNEGNYEIEFAEPEREDTMRISTRRVLWEGRSWLQERARRIARLPELTAVFAVDSARLLEKLTELPDEMNLVLKLFDGKRSLREIVASCELDELSSLSALSRMLADAIIQDASLPAQAQQVEAQAQSIAPRADQRVGLRTTLDYHVPHLDELTRQRQSSKTTTLRPERPSVERTLRGMQAPHAPEVNPFFPVLEPGPGRAPASASHGIAPPERVTVRPEPPRRARARRKRTSSASGIPSRRARTFASSSPALPAVPSDGDARTTDAATAASAEEHEPGRGPVSTPSHHGTFESRLVRGLILASMVVILGVLAALLAR